MLRAQQIAVRLNRPVFSPTTKIAVTAIAIRVLIATNDQGGSRCLARRPRAVGRTSSARRKAVDGCVVLAKAACPCQELPRPLSKQRAAGRRSRSVSWLRTQPCCRVSSLQSPLPGSGGSCPGTGARVQRRGSQRERHREGISPLSLAGRLFLFLSCGQGSPGLGRKLECRSQGFGCRFRLRPGWHLDHCEELDVLRRRADQPGRRHLEREPVPATARTLFACACRSVHSECRRHATSTITDFKPCFGGESCTGGLQSTRSVPAERSSAIDPQFAETKWWRAFCRSSPS